jgi:hypothetical protein
MQKQKKLSVSNPSVKKKIFISALKSSIYRDFMIIRIQEIKISLLGTFKGTVNWPGRGDVSGNSQQAFNSSPFPPKKK